MTMPTLDQDKAIARLMRFLATSRASAGEETPIGSEVVKALRAIGVPEKAICFDDANARIPLPTQTGNLIVTLPGTKPGPRRLFSTHLDTVPLCAGAAPLRKGNRIVPQGKTALGGDNRTGVACLVTMLAELHAQKLSHGPMTVLFTVREESGLWGARMVEPKELGDPVIAFIDSRLGLPRTATSIDAVGRGSLGGRDRRQGVARRRPSRTRHFSHDGRRASAGGNPCGGMVRQGETSGQGRHVQRRTVRRRRRQVRGTGRPTSLPTT